jgi:DNA-binding transcriptional LysR family regulator
MELVALRTFQAVVEEGGILAASRKLNTVQSNVTGRIRRLEEELGTELFFRKGRGLELAPSGRVLIQYAQRMLLLERQTSAAIRQVGDNVGELRVGSMETFAALHLPAALKALREAHPGLELRVSHNPTPHFSTVGRR